jgi:hypothetical protein
LRLLRHAVILAVIVASVHVADAQSPDDIITTIQDAAARHGVSPARLVQVARCESRLNPNAVGRLGEQGVFQLHPQGELRTFYARGFSSPWDVAEAAEFTAQRFAEGAARAWSCAR